MDGDGERVRDLQQQLHQLDVEAEASALTPGEAEKNRNEREAVLEELAKHGWSPAPRDGGSGSTAR